MKSRVLIIVAALLLSLPALANDQPPDGPYKTVKDATDQMLAKLVQVQPLYKSDPDKFYAEIKQSMAPFIDFEGFARGVMAKYYRRASPQQREEFADKFQQELIRTYSGALMKFNNQKVEVLPLQEPPRDGRASVDIKIHGDSDTIYPVQYSMVFVEGHWKVRNVVVNGINIGLQFRGQFANYMQEYHNNIDKVIANWDVHGASNGT